jgi:hypothetical protein
MMHSMMGRSGSSLRVSGLVPQRGRDLGSCSRWTASVALAAGTLLIGAAAPIAVAQEQITEDAVIAGTMSITFNTHTSKDTTGDLVAGSPAIGVKDLYKFDLTVAKTTNFSGEITRQPNLFTSTLRRRKQDAELAYAIDLAVMNPRDLKQRRVVGKWVGRIPIDQASGAFDLAGGSAKDSPLRIAVDTVGRAQGFEERFGGRLVGKAEKKDGLAGYTYKRLVGGKEVSFVVKRSDPMRFENIQLAMGPATVYPRSIVSGRLDYDYETGNWITDGIRFRYSLDGKEIEDIVTGTIKWVEDPDRASNGKGYYDFNLRFNEEKNKSATGEGAAFEGAAGEDAFFAVDNTIPCLTGRISYTDSFASDGETVTTSQIVYDLDANKLTKQQIVNFFKLWMVCVGPTNDE